MDKSRWLKEFGGCELIIVSDKSLQAKKYSTQLNDLDCDIRLLLVNELSNIKFDFPKLAAVLIISEPESSSVLTTVKWFAQQEKELPIIVLSDKINDINRLELLERGAHRILDIDINSKELLFYLDLEIQKYIKYQVLAQRIKPNNKSNLTQESDTEFLAKMISITYMKMLQLVLLLEMLMEP